MKEAEKLLCKKNYIAVAIGLGLSVVFTHVSEPIDLTQKITQSGNECDMNNDQMLDTDEIKNCVNEMLDYN